MTSTDKLLTAIFSLQALRTIFDNLYARNAARNIVGQTELLLRKLP